ncbi:MAG: hypothetical protein Q8Q96_00715 [bacterium]|nr:hypothetical protein [bacterium]
MGGTETGRRPTPEITHAYLQETLGLDYWNRIVNELVRLGYYSVWDEVPPRNDPPLLHEESDAFYLLEQDRGHEIIYVQFLPPNSRTSYHKHSPPVTEDYNVFDGELYLNDMQLPRETFTVGFDIPHQATTKDKPAVTILRTNNVLGIPRDQIHIREAVATSVYPLGA